MYFPFSLPSFIFHLLSLLFIILYIPRSFVLCLNYKYSFFIYFPANVMLPSFLLSTLFYFWFLSDLPSAVFTLHLMSSFAHVFLVSFSPTPFFFPRSPPVTQCPLFFHLCSWMLCLAPTIFLLLYFYNQPRFCLPSVYILLVLAFILCLLFYLWNFLALKNNFIPFCCSPSKVSQGKTQTAGFR